MHDPMAPAPLSSRKPRRGRVALAFGAILVLVVGAWWYFTRPSGDGASADSAAQAKGGDAKKGAGKGGRFGADPSRTQPVAAGLARKSDIRIIQTSLGTVTALATVTVK